MAEATYRIAYGPQTENGTYHFVLSQTLLDAEGFQLDQDADGVPGEPEDTFAFTLILDTTLPRITQHSPSGGVPLGLGSMEIEFNEAIDAATFNPADAAIITPAGETNAITGVQALTSNRFRITFPPFTASGIHQLRVGPSVQDLAGNSLDQDQDGIAGEGGDDVYDACFYVHGSAGAGLLSWWRAEGNAFDNSSANDGTLVNGADFAPGKIGSAFVFSHTSDSVRVPHSEQFQFGLLTSA